MSRKSSDLREQRGASMYVAPNVEVPVTTVIERLNMTGGPGLELTTRTHPALAMARASGYIYTNFYGIGLVGGLSDTAMRLAVSQDGMGREDMIHALEAGGQLPSEYYENPRSGEASETLDEETDKRPLFGRRKSG